MVPTGNREKIRTVIRGSSGAEITINQDTVTKWDTSHTVTRVRDQGIWLRKHEKSRVLPRIVAIHRYGYTMEKLDVFPLPRSAGEILKTCDKLLSLLREYIWELSKSSYGLIEFDRGDHDRYVRKLLKDVDLTELRSTLRDFADRILWHRVSTNLTHGDPIIDNVMLRPVEGSRTGAKKTIIIDPIPATPALPDFVAVDVGRIIQSASGYEALRYDDGELQEHIGVQRAVDHVLNRWFEDRDFNIHDARAALLFSIIHIMRGIRTAQRVAPRCVEPLHNLTHQLVEETRYWMR